MTCAFVSLFNNEKRQPRETMRSGRRRRGRGFHRSLVRRRGRTVSMWLTSIHNWGDQSISASRYGFYESGIVRRIAQNLAKPVYSCIHAGLELDDGIVRPEALAQVLAKHKFARSFQKGSQNSQRLFRQAYSLFLRTAEFTATNVELESLKSNFALGLLHPQARTTECGNFSIETGSVRVRFGRTLYVASYWKYVRITLVTQM